MPLSRVPGPVRGGDQAGGSLPHGAGPGGAAGGAADEGPRRRAGGNGICRARNDHGFLHPICGLSARPLSSIWRDFSPRTSPMADLQEAMRYSLLARRQAHPPGADAGVCPSGRDQTGIWLCPMPARWSWSTPTPSSTTTCPVWTTTTCAGASPPTTRSTARRWRCWRGTPCSRRPFG